MLYISILTLIVEIILIDKIKPVLTPCNLF